MENGALTNVISEWLRSPDLPPLTPIENSPLSRDELLSMPLWFLAMVTG